MKHLLRDDDLSGTEQQEILALAAQMKQEPYGHRALDGPPQIAVMFDKSSTRTRISFAVGISELGGNAVILDSATTQAQRGEPVADTARVLGRMTDAIVWRTFAQADLDEMAAYAGVPVINALSDDFHPCQLLADLLTIREYKSRTAGLTMTFLGDGASNMAHSYLLAGSTAAIHVRIGCPASHAPDAAVVETAEEIAGNTGGSILVTDDPCKAIADADVVATDTWVSMGQEDDKEQRTATMAPYAVTGDALSRAAGDVIVLHCLPAYRGMEISADVIDGPHSVVWDEAENRVHAQKALLAWLIG